MFSFMIPLKEPVAGTIRGIHDYFYAVEYDKVTRVSLTGETKVISRPGQEDFSGSVWHLGGVNYFSFDSDRYLLRLPEGEVEPRSSSHYITLPSDKGWGRYSWDKTSSAVTDTKTGRHLVYHTNPGFVWNGSVFTTPVYARNLCFVASMEKYVCIDLQSDEKSKVLEIPPDTQVEGATEFQGHVWLFVTGKQGSRIIRER